jgi:hypothetical protein
MLAAASVVIQSGIWLAFPREEPLNIQQNTNESLRGVTKLPKRKIILEDNIILES